MKKQIYKLLLGLFPCLVGGCETITVIDLPKDEPRMVLNALLQPDSLFIVNLSRTITDNVSQYYYDNDTYMNSFYLDNAEIKVYVDDQYQGVMQKEKEKGKYSMPDIRIETGQTVLLEASAEGFPCVVAQTIVVAPPVKLNVKLTPDNHTGDPDWDNRYDMQVTFSDDGKSQNYYLLRITAEEKIEREGETDRIYNTIYMRDRGNILLDHEDTFILSPYFYSNGYGYYSYYSSGLQNYIFTNELFKAGEYTLNFQLNNVRNSYYSDTLNYTMSLKTELCSISESYYLYLRSKVIQFEQGDFFGEIGLREPMPTYTNVKGGYGITGAQAKLTEEIVTPASDVPPEIYW